MQHWVISALGPDQPGLVDELTRVLTEYRGNIADSRMVNLGGQFAMVLSVQVNEEDAGALARQLPEVAKQLGMTLHHVSGGVEAGGGESGVPYRIRTYAMDQMGLVHRISHLLHQHGVNIEQLDTRLHHGPHSGTPLFSMDMIVTIPQGVKLKAIRDELETLCEQLNCDLDIDHA